MPIERMPNGDLVNFPDGTTPDQIKEMVAKKFPHDVAAHLRNTADAIQSGMSWKDVASNAVSNIPSSAGQFAESVAQPIMHPVQTAENVGNIGKGVLQKLGVMSGKDAEPYADAVGKFFIDRYGSEDNIKKTIATDPVGVLADVATVVSGGGGALARAPGVIGKVGEVAGAVGRAVDPLSAAGKAAKVAGRGVSEFGGIYTGAGSDAIQTAAKAGAEGGEAGKAFIENLAGKAPQEQVVAEAKTAVQQLRTERGNAYRTEMAKIGADNTVLDFTKIDNAVAGVSKVKSYKGQSLSPTTEGIRQSISDAVEQWKNLDPKQFHTAEGLDALKQKIGDLRDGTQFGTPERLVADQIYQAVRKTIIDQAPEYAKVMKGYEEASDLIREMEKTLSLNPKASIDTSLRKLQSVMRNNVSTNYGRRAELVDFLSRAGAPHLMEKLAGQALGEWAPRGLSRLIVGGEGAAILANPEHAAHLAAGIIGSSPRLWGAAAYGAGAATRLPLRTLGRSAFQTGRLPQ